MAKRLLVPAAIVAATAGGFAVLALHMNGGALHAAANPSWPLLGVAFVIMALAQPLRAMGWRATLRSEVGFKAVYAASSVGSFLDTVLPARLGEASKVGVLRVSAGRSWPGFSRAAGTLLCAHLLEGLTFVAVGAGAAFFLPLPGWAQWTMTAAFLLSAGVIALASALHTRIGARLPAALDRFLAGAAAPRRVLLHAGATLLATWVIRWIGLAVLLHALGVKAGLGSALVYMIVTGLANTAPILPGNAGVYQGAALGALALVGEAGSKALAVGLVAPVFASVVTAAAALVGVAVYGRRFAELPRAAFRRA